MRSNHTILTDACAYLRMSSDKQDTSLAIQRATLIELAERLNCRIIEWYCDEGVTASRRPESRADWMRLLADAKTAKWKMVLIYSRSRFSRLDSIQEGFAKQILREARKTLHAAIEGPVDWNSAQGRIMDTINAEGNHEYSRRLGKNCLDGRLLAFNAGKTPGRVCPYGMARRVIDPRGEKRDLPRTDSFPLPKGWTWVPIPGDDAEVEVVQRIFDHFVRKDTSYRSLARKLNREGITTPDGVKWVASAIARILRNEIYVGDTAIGKVKVGDFARLEDGRVVPCDPGLPFQRTSGMVRRNTHEGIIDRDTWDMAQAKLKRIKDGIRRLPRDEGGYALTGILLCGHCGRTLNVRRNLGSRKMGVPIYGCRSPGDFGKESGCSHWRIYERDILPLLISKLAKEVDEKVLRSYSVQPPIPRQKDRAKQERKLREFERKVELARENVLTANPDIKPGLEKKLREWESKLQEMRAEFEEGRDAKTKMQKELQDWQRWFSAARKKLIRVREAPEKGCITDAGLLYTPETFREALLSFGCRVYVWWKKRGATKFFDVFKVRIMLGYKPRKNEGGDENPGIPAKKGPKTPAPSGASSSKEAPLGAAVINIVLGSKHIHPHTSHEEILQIVLESVAKGRRLNQIAYLLNEGRYITRRGLPWDRYSVRSFIKAYVSKDYQPRVKRTVMRRPRPKG